MSWQLSNIIGKVRSVTGTPSNDQLTDAQITDYINNYYVFTMPFELKEQIENTFLDFKTVVGQDIYKFPGGYFTDQPGAYADGFPLIFYQDPDIFYQDWPIQYGTDNLATGNGVLTNFTGGLQNPPVIIGSLFITDGTQVLQDVGPPATVTEIIAVGSGIANYSGTLGLFPITTGSLSITDGTEIFTDNGLGILSGNMGGTGTIVYATGVWAVTFAAVVAIGINITGTYSDPYQGSLTGDGVGTINYATGAFNVNFNTAPAPSATIYAKYQGYAGNRPQGILFFQNEFTLRPVPDQVYQIHLQGYIKPIGLIGATDTPLQEEWGQLIAYGASLDIFTDRGDLENYERYYTIFKRFESVALGRTIQQLTAEQSVPRF